MSAKGIKKVCLDLDDTLMPTNYRYHQASWRCGFIIATALGFRSPQPADVILLQRQIDNKLFKTFGFKVDRFPTSWVDTYKMLADRAGVKVDQEICRRLFNTASHFKVGPFRAFVDAKAALRKILKARPGRELHLITAGEQWLQTRKVEQAGLGRYFEPGNIHVTDGGKVELLKQIAGDDPGSVVMVGDSKRNDIKAAKSLKIVCVWIPSETRSSEDAAIVPDHEIRSIGELPELIARLDAELRKGKKP